jgi:opacity protein-like surface antigen
MFIFQFLLKANCQEINISGGLAMPLNPYSGKDITDNANGHALLGYNFKFDYIILKQSSINFSLGLLYLNNGFDVKNIENQYNSINSKKPVFTSLKPFTGLGFGSSIFFYFTPIKHKFKGYSKFSLGQLFVNSPEYTNIDSLVYIKYLSANSNSIYLGLCVGVEYNLTPQISIIGFTEYFYSKVNFGNVKASNISGQVATILYTKANEQALESLNFNIGLSFKLYHSITNFKKKIK